MALASGSRWVPTSGGGMVLVDNNGTTLFTITPAGLSSFTGTTGAFTPPALTTAQRDALTAAAGMVIFNTTTNKLNVRGASAWEAVTSV